MNKNKFRERLKLGQNKEQYVNDILNLCNIPSEPNNKENIYDMDLWLPYDNIYMDVKYLETSFNGSHIHKDLTADNCLILTLRHLNNYEDKRIATGKDTWIAFLINFKDQGVYELRFIRTEDIKKLEFEYERAFRRNIINKNKLERIINLIRTDCLTMVEFLNYIDNIRYNKKFILN